MLVFITNPLTVAFHVEVVRTALVIALLTETIERESNVMDRWGL